MNFFSNNLLRNLQSSIKELFVSKAHNDVHHETEKTSICEVEGNVVGVHGNKQSTENKYTFVGSSNGKNVKQRKSQKILTTCHKCGHYRFAKRNSKRIINENYPFEHSAKGGCPVAPRYYVKPGAKFRKLCVCVHCTLAAQMFNHNPDGNKKKNQYKYDRTPEQELVWLNLKNLGWYCRKGKYFSPGMKYNKCAGLTADLVF